MIWRHREPTLEEMLSDSIIQAVMAADGVDPRELEASLRRAIAPPPVSDFHPKPDGASRPPCATL
jgi:hypothetical protein